MRVKRGISTRKHHKQITKKTKGYLQSRGNFRKAKEAVLKAGQYGYRDRRNKKRTRRSLWVVQINAGLKKYNLSYSRFINGLTRAQIELDRKILANLANTNPQTFEKIAQIAQKTLENVK